MEFQGTKFENLVEGYFNKQGKTRIHNVKPSSCESRIKVKSKPVVQPGNTTYYKTRVQIIKPQ